MYKELVKELRDPCPHENCILCQKAADAIEELQQIAEHYKGCFDDWYREACDYKATIPHWIPVTERLPDVFKHVLVNIPGMAPFPTVQEAFSEKNGLWYSNGFRYEADEITHWMPLPEPPKEKR